MVLIPLRKAAKDFSLNPPIGRALPLKVTSPVRAISGGTGVLLKAEMMAQVMAAPADGPSFGTAPSGT